MDLADAGEAIAALGRSMVAKTDRMKAVEGMKHRCPPLLMLSSLARVLPSGSTERQSIVLFQLHSSAQSAAIPLQALPQPLCVLARSEAQPESLHPGRDHP